MSSEAFADAIVAAVRAEGLLAGTEVLVLLSGGRDSTCLLDIAVRVAGAGRVQALHVDYGLRAGSVADAAHCERLCRRLGVPLTVERPARPPDGNVQAWARAERYGAADRRARERDVGAVECMIAVGHTASDQVETILYRLVSSPSRRAFTGMSARRGRVVRPLLRWSRADTTAYCEARGLGWRDDPTNAEPAYVRNRIRSELLPLLAELHPGAEANIRALAARLRAEGEALDTIVDEQILAGRTQIPLVELRALDDGLRPLVVQRLADAVHAGAGAAGVARRTSDVCAMGPDALLDLPSGVRARTRAGVLSFELTPPLGRQLHFEVS